MAVMLCSVFASLLLFVASDYTSGLWRRFAPGGHSGRYIIWLCVMGREEGHKQQLSASGTCRFEQALGVDDDGNCSERRVVFITVLIIYW